MWWRAAGDRRDSVGLRADRTLHRVGDHRGRRGRARHHLDGEGAGRRLPGGGVHRPYANRPGHAAGDPWDHLRWEPRRLRGWARDAYDHRAGRVNVTGLRDPKESVEEALEAMRKELHDAGVECTEVEWSVASDRALPRNRPVGNRPRGPELETGVFGAGDAFLAPSLEGAMRSGRKAAEAWVSWQREAQHSS